MLFAPRFFCCLKRALITERSSSSFCSFLASAFLNSLILLLAQDLDHAGLALGHEISAKAFLDAAACANDGLVLLNDALLGSDDEILLKLKRVDPDSFDTEILTTNERSDKSESNLAFSASSC